MDKLRDNYSDDETEPLYGYNRPAPEKKEWDIFDDPPVKATSASLEESKWIDNSVVFLKILFYILIFFLVLFSATISQATLLFATSQIAPNITRPYCNRDLGKNQQFIVTLPDTERVAWMWTLVFIFFMPEAIMFLRCLRIVAFKSWKLPTLLEFLSYFVTETLPTIGYAILVFVVLPDMDVIKGAMLMNAFCIIPACLSVFSRNPKQLNNSFKMILDVLSVIAQVTALVAWPLISNDWSLFHIPLCIVFISFGWWENYLSEDSPIPFISYIGKTRKQYPNSRYFAYIFITVWKCLLFFCSMLVIVYLREDTFQFLFDELYNAFQDHTINITEIQPIVGPAVDLSDAIATGNGTVVTTSYMTPLSVFLINSSVSFACYLFTTFACQILIQGFSFAFPINLAVPVTLSGLIAMCGFYVKDECAFYGTIPGYLFFNTPNYYDLNDFIGRQYSWIWLIWLLSQTWVTIHTWNPCSERVTTVEKIFMKPLYDAFLVGQSLAMSRRREENYLSAQTEGVQAAAIGVDDNLLVDGIKETIPRVYACATMWHETKEEMMEFLKSVMRLDEDQSSRRIVRHYMGFDIPDYYELETHIFFDDAFLRTHQDDNDPHVNEFVLTLTSAISDAATEVHQTAVIIAPPKVTITPYGGRLTWTLPGRTRMIAHLKDKKKIRAKKRWSQVMYMYYLLGHRLMQNDFLTPDKKDTIAKNTFILALDGDIDFQPQAVQLLLDLMRKNQALGAACGRIHPIGSGPMVWYQMFEYAIGHWLQKAAEHTIGCVLCSPGCFSLFRGSALMDDNVMKKYTTRSEEPRHYVQYDQGEDRWLCTLLLQRGYRVEYSAASDAYTHCPESFNEFYNQRRRWIPSTTANILDLLMDYKRTVKGNDNISQLYILYQLVLMVGTVLGPGTIFLMLVGAIVAAFQTDQWTSFLWNVVPVAIFLFVCAMFESKIQLFVAGLLSALYGLVMMAVLIGIVLQIDNDGFFAPSSLFFFCVAMEMIIAAALHPKEFYCLKYGVVYYITIPSMYMLLIIYSVFNMNNVSWGTREVTVVPKGDNNKDAKQGGQPAKKEQKNKILHFFGVDTNHDAGSIEFAFAGLFKCLFCTHKKDTVENEQLRAIQNSIEALSTKLDVIERQIVGGGVDNYEARPSRRKTTVLEGARASRSISQLNISKPFDSMSTDSQSLIMSDVEPNSWLYDGDLARGEVDDLPSREEMFWKELIEEYLQPIDDTDRKEQIAKGLKDLRDKMVVAFFMINALFVLVLFLLTLKKELLHFKWPFDVKYNFTYSSDSGEIRLTKTYLELEPLGLVFVLFFAALLVVQFIAMIFHRLDTLSQILSTTILNLSFFKTAPEDLTADEMLEKNPVEIAKSLQKLKGINESDERKEEESVDRRKTAFNLAVSRGNKGNQVNDLNVAFRRRLAKFIGDPNYRGPVRRETVAAINRRRDTVVRRKSLAPNHPANINPAARPEIGRDNPGFLDDYETFDSVI